MKEVKYRAWLDYEKRMIEWENLHLETSRDNTTGKVSFMLWVGDDEDNNFGSACGESCFKLMQCTGLEDKNGVEIYVGDIVNQLSEMTYDSIQGVVKMVDGSYLIETFDGTTGNYLFGEVVFNEIVGNIYENPEFLEVAE